MMRGSAEEGRGGGHLVRLTGRADYDASRVRHTTSIIQPGPLYLRPAQHLLMQPSECSGS